MILVWFDLIQFSYLINCQNYPNLLHSYLIFLLCICRIYIFILQIQYSTMSRGYRMLVLFISLLFISSCFKLSLRQQPNGYDRNTSLRYVSYAAVAFCPKNCVESWSCGTTAKYPKLVNVTYIENSISKAAGYIGYDPSTQTIISAWRGSNNIQNWIQDFNFQMQPYTPCKGCFVHSGFMSDYRLNQKKLLAAAQAIVRFYKVSRIVCTGHSLGAALAFINGIEFVHKFPGIPVEVHNFGSPRVGNHPFSLYLKQKLDTIYRVVHNRDIVPHLPPEVNYHHPPFQVFYDLNNTNYKICSDSGEDKSCSNQYFPNYTTADHDFYLIRIGETKCC